jgi:hypothetical protein
VPAPFLALLLEYGVHPAEIGVTDLHDTGMTAWESRDPVITRTRATAHIERASLERALTAAAARNSGVTVASAVRQTELATILRVIDATGRQAISATSRFQPPAPMLARVFVMPGHFSPAAQAVHIAALPFGYIYRLGCPTMLTIGIVAAKEHQPASTTAIEALVRREGAGWILAGLPSLTTMRSGRGGVASVQWTKGPGSPLRVGDAALARDSLSSQGLANGVANALRVLDDPPETVSGESQAGAGPSREARERDAHLSSLVTMLRRCRYGSHPTWAGYTRFLLSSQGISPRKAFEDGYRYREAAVGEKPSRSSGVHRP